MGNCLPTLRKKNRVEPAPEEEDVHEVLSRATVFKAPKTNAPEDMVKALKEEGTRDQIIVTDKATPSAKKAVAFTVELDNNDVKPRMPKRLAERLSVEKEPKHEIEYTCEEESLMADIIRETRLKEVKEKARQEDIKLYDAHRRRLVAERSKEARAESNDKCSTPSLDDQRKKVKDLADEDSGRAAERRREEEKTE